MTHDAAAGLQIIVHRAFDIAIIAIDGEVDLATAAQVTASIEDVLAESTPAALIVDLTGVSFLASIGMTVLVKASDRVGGLGRFAVVADGPTTRRPLVLTGLDQTLAIYADVDSAVAALAS